MNALSNKSWRYWMRAIGSLWMAAVLLVLLLFTLACATAMESISGTESALEYFYQAWWFKALLVLLSINVIAAVVVRWPFSKRQVGFVLTHTGIIVTLVGAYVTQQWAMDGQIGLAEGQSTTEFRNPGQLALTLANRSSKQNVKTYLDESVFDGLEIVDHQTADSVSMDGVSVEVLRYLPDAVAIQRMVNDNPRSQPAIEISLAHGDHAEKAWIFAGRPKKVHSTSIAYREINNQLALSKFLAHRNQEKHNADAADSIGNILIEIAGKSYTFSLEDSLDSALPIGDSSLTFRVVRYLPHATVGADSKLTNMSPQPVNPAVEVEVIGPDGTEKRLAFAKFPDFSSMHGDTTITDLKVTFVTTSQDTPSVPIEIVRAPDGEYFVRFTTQDNSTTVHPLAMDTAVQTPWADQAITLIAGYDHARLEWNMNPVTPIRKNREPAIQVKISTSQYDSNMWIPKHRMMPLTIDGKPFEVTFSDEMISLGFNVVLNRFHIGYYPGTMRPRTFESHITLTDDTGLSVNRVVSMNHPVSFGKYTLYQSSYKQDGKNIYSYLSVANDPGMMVTFAGYIILIAGMIVVLVIRMSERPRTGVCLVVDANAKISQRKITAIDSTSKNNAGHSHGQQELERDDRPAKKNPQRDRNKTKKVTGLGFIAALLMLLPSSALSAELPQTLDLTSIRSLVTQHDGRWPPLDTLARDKVWRVTGAEFFQGRDPVLVFLAWNFDPQFWMNEPLISIANAELRGELALSSTKKVFSYKELIEHPRLRQLTKDLSKRNSSAKMNPLESKVASINEKLSTLGEVFMGGTIHSVPHPTDPQGAWTSISSASVKTAASSTQQAWLQLHQAFNSDDAAAFTTASQNLHTQLQNLPAAYRPSGEKIAVELHYNQLQPYQLSWEIMLAATMLAALAMWIRKRWFDGLVALGLISGFAVLTYGLWLRWAIAGRIPASNMFESLLFLSWGMGLFAIFAMIVFNNRMVPLTACGMGALALLLADCLPMNHFIRPIPPVLADTIWMSIHVPIIMVSYSVLALAMLIAHVQVAVMCIAPKRKDWSVSLDATHYWYVHVGSILLLIGIVTGSMWAASSWGRYWGWDPKEVWSLVAFLGYITILHVRIDHEVIPRWVYGLGFLLFVLVFALAITRIGSPSGAKLLVYTGAAVALAIFVFTHGAFATATKSIMAFWLIIMTYVGVNYVLGIGLHSYGFGTGAVAHYMFLTGGIDLGLVALCAIVYLWRRRRIIMTQDGQSIDPLMRRTRITH